MTPVQRDLFREALKQRRQLRSIPPSLARWTAGSVSLSGTPFVRTVETRDGSVRLRDERAAADAGPENAGLQAGIQGSGNSAASGPSGRTETGTVVTRYPLTRVRFSLAYGPDLEENVEIFVMPHL
jgi:hypothetical protein